MGDKHTQIMNTYGEFKENFLKSEITNFLRTGVMF